MALSANTVWELRTTGSDSSGGGFVAGASGTDYSQQDAAQFSGTDLAVDATTNTKVTSASHNFVATDVGNIIQITAGTGFTTGWYQIVSVASNAATLDRSPGATSITGGTWAEGGALASPGMAALAADSFGGSTVYQKAGTYSISSSTANVSGGRISFTVTGTAPRWVGYQTTRLDFGTPPVIQANTTSFNIFTCQVNSLVVENIVLDGNNKASVNGTSFTGRVMTFRGCTAKNCVVGFGGANASAGLISMSGCLAAANSSHGFQVDAQLFRCASISNGGSGFLGSGTGFSTVECIASGNTAAGFSDGTVCLFAMRSVAYNNATGFSLSRACSASSCIAYGNSGTGISIGTHAVADNCAVGSNGTNITAGLDGAQQINLITLTADPFTNKSGGDFSLNNTVGGGALLRGLSFAFPGISTTGYDDAGAVQHKDSVGGRLVNGGLVAA